LNVFVSIDDRWVDEPIHVDLTLRYFSRGNTWCLTGTENIRGCAQVMRPAQRLFSGQKFIDRITKVPHDFSYTIKSISEAICYKEILRPSVSALKNDSGAQECSFF